MLKEIVEEWEAACQNAVKVEDRMNEDGVTFEMKKSIVTFRNTQIEMVAKRRPGSGLVKDGELDPSKGPRYLVTIFVPSTKKILEAIPSSDICPQTERMIAILQSLEVYDHEELVTKRVSEFKTASTANQIAEWKQKLDGTDFTDAEKEIFIEYAKPILSKRIIKYRADMFFSILQKLHKLIIATDLEACGAAEANKKISYTLADVMYNMTCQCIEKQQTNTHGDYFIPKFVIENRFWNADNDAKMSLYIRVARSTFRQIFTECNERPAILAYVLNGMAKYYEATTGESVDLRIARNAERKKNKPQKQTEGESADGKKPARRYKKTERIEVSTGTTENVGLGSMASLFAKVGL